MWGLSTALVAMVLLPGCGSADAHDGTPRFYRVARQDGVWSVVAPDGRPFFSLGVDCVERGAAREAYRADRPRYAAFRHYASDNEWAAGTLARLRAWGFNTLGAWSDDAVLGKARDPLPYTVELELGGSARVPWCDLFGTEIERIFDQVAREQVLPRRDDPLLLGYFTDNELGWWDDSIFLTFLGEPAANSTRQVLIRLLEQHYRGDFGRLCRDWQPEGASSFDDLEQGGTMALRAGGNGMAVVRRFVGACAERYYRLAHDAVRRYDRNHLILGDRYAQWASEPVVQAAGRYVDVVSTNLGADWADGGICRYYPDMLHRLTGRPVLISETYFAAMENRSGNRNAGLGFPTVPTQRERAAGYARNTRALAGLPYVLGAHWFQYADEPTGGRSDGEDYDFGLVDIEDRPYDDLVVACARVAVDMPALRKHAAAPRTQDAIPIAPADQMEGLLAWDRDRGYVAPARGVPCADLYACYDAQTLYVAVIGADYVDERLYAGGKIPQSERTRLDLRVGAMKRNLTVRFGAGGVAQVEGVGVRVKEWPGMKHTLIVAIPAALVSSKPLSPGREVGLRATLTRHSRAGAMSWHTTLRLAGTAHD